MSKWFETLKMVYSSGWMMLKDFPESEDNPIAVILTPDLKGEVWDNKIEAGGKGSYGRSWHNTVTAEEGSNLLVSNYGRVKENGVIVVPEIVKTRYGSSFGVKFYGNVKDYKQNRYKSKYDRSKKYKESKGFKTVKWGITVDWLKSQGIDIPSGTKLFVSGKLITVEE